MKVYKVRHIPTGLFFRPGPNGNLHENGKIYSNKPNLKVILVHDSGAYTGYVRIRKTKYSVTREPVSDFEIVEFDLSQPEGK